MPLTTEAPEAIEPPVLACHLISPVLASIPYTLPFGSVDPAYTTPLAVVIWPIAPKVFCAGSAVCHRILPVVASSASQKPPLVDVRLCGDGLLRVVCTWPELASAT